VNVVELAEIILIFETSATAYFPRNPPKHFVTPTVEPVNQSMDQYFISCDEVRSDRSNTNICNLIRILIPIVVDYIS